ncbi:DMT family transporter, partial [Leclercia adecarboxylata]|uniref:DMT family transporter n=1 Tax=Leclercia adecarboxylata TaxID=83655 RepID=UPI00234CA050
ALMLTAGAAWGVYSLRGAGRSDPIAATTWNFIAPAPLALLLNLATLGSAHASAAGIGWAALSGAIASAIGYVIWYRVLPLLPAIVAATVQLSAPMLAAIGGVVLLGEPATTRLGLAGVAILGGIAIVI